MTKYNQFFKQQVVDFYFVNHKNSDQDWHYQMCSYQHTVKIKRTESDTILS